ncbi:helix-turn-helix transcriptional regulator [Morganella morganii]|uniref:helix-turn-helix transcriptional regulator n=1 Tax=Morganella morganii TaxID=582 RepID=UPI0004688277|nr:helix-turn-helix transcriptional regulator [Morganella morganii]
MTEKMYLKLNLIISAFRDRETLTAADVATAMGWTNNTANTKMRILEEIGAAIQVSPENKRPILYAVTSGADACLDSYYAMAGNRFLKGFDAKLREARRGMPTVQ